MTRTGYVRLIVPIAAIGLLLASCSDDDGGSSTAASEQTTTTVSACAEADALRASVDELGAVDVQAEGTDGVTAAVDTVKDDLAALESTVSAELQPEVDAVQAGIDQLDTAVDDFDTDGAAPVLEAVATVTSASAALVESLDTGACGS